MTMKWRISCRSRYIAVSAISAPLTACSGGGGADQKPVNSEGVAIEMDPSTREVDDIRWNLERGVAAPLYAYPTERRAYAPDAAKMPVEKSTYDGAQIPGLSRDAA